MKDLIAKLRHSEYIHYSLTYLATFVLSIHYVLVLYTNSSLLSRYASDDKLGLLYVLGSLVTILILTSASYILERFGNRKMMLGLVVIEFASLLTMGFSSNPLAVIFAFMAHEGVAYVLLFNLDVFLENGLVRNAHVGEARGLFLTATNVAYVGIPSLVGLILANNEYWKVYGLSALVLVPLFILIYREFKNFKDPRYAHHDYRKTISLFFKDGQLAKVFKISFTLQFFYACMVVYMPLYLHEHIGFSWPTIGAMFSVMLLPFVIFQIPGGYLADKYGVHRYLIIALALLGLSTVGFAFLSTTSALIWTALLFSSRVGASIVEVMTESFFYRHIGGKDAGFMSIYLMANPLSYVIAPLFCGALLWLGGFKLVFFATGITVIWAMQYVSGL